MKNLLVTQLETYFSIVLCLKLQLIFLYSNFALIFVFYFPSGSICVRKCRTTHIINYLAYFLFWMPTYQQRSPFCPHPFHLFIRRHHDHCNLSFISPMPWDMTWKWREQQERSGMSWRACLRFSPIVKWVRAKGRGNILVRKFKYSHTTRTFTRMQMWEFPKFYVVTHTHMMMTAVFWV